MLHTNHMKSTEPLDILVFFGLVGSLFRALKFGNLFKYGIFHAVESANCMTPNKLLLCVSAAHLLTDFDDVCDKRVKFLNMHFLEVRVLECDVTIAHIEGGNDLTLAQINKNLDVKVYCTLTLSLFLA